MNALTHPRSPCVTRRSFEALEGAEELERDLLDSPLGIELQALLRKAEDINLKSEREWERAVLAGRRSSFRQSLEAKLAEQLLNLIGSADDCFVVRVIAEGAVS